MAAARRYRELAAKILLGGLEEARNGMIEEHYIRRRWNSPRLEEARNGMIEELGEFLSNGRYEVFCTVAGIDKERYRTECQMALSDALATRREDG